MKASVLVSCLALSFALSLGLAAADPDPKCKSNVGQPTALGAVCDATPPGPSGGGAYPNYAEKRDWACCVQSFICDEPPCWTLVTDILATAAKSKNKIKSMTSAEATNALYEYAKTHPDSKGISDTELMKGAATRAKTSHAVTLDNGLIILISHDSKPSDGMPEFLSTWTKKSTMTEEACHYGQSSWGGPGIKIKENEPAFGYGARARDLMAGGANDYKEMEAKAWTIMDMLANPPPAANTSEVADWEDNLLTLLLQGGEHYDGLCKVVNKIKAVYLAQTPPIDPLSDDNLSQFIDCKKSWSVAAGAGALGLLNGGKRTR